MRKGIDYIGVGVCAVISNEEGKFFLAKRGEEARNESGKWEFPGGSIEFGDTLKDSIIREMQEELGIEIAPSDQLSAIDHIIPDENQHWVAHAFMAKIVKGEPKILEPEKCEEIGWFSITEMKNMDITLALKAFPILEEYLANKQQMRNLSTH